MHKKEFGILTIKHGNRLKQCLYISIFFVFFIITPYLSVTVNLYVLYRMSLVCKIMVGRFNWGYALSAHLLSL